MKKNYKQCKTRFLLFFLLSLFAGGLSPAWAGTLTESFESVTVDPQDNTKLSNGWFIKGGTNIVTKNVTNSSYWSNNMPNGYDYIILGTGGSYNIGANGTNTAFGQYNNGCTSYLVIPTELTGKIKFYAGGIRTSNTNIKLYRVSYNSSTDEYSIGTQIGSTIYPSARSSSTTRPNWLASKQEVDLGSEHTMVAFLLNGTAIDELEAEEYVFTPYVEPATIAAAAIGNTAEVSWTAGETVETLTGWNLEYKKSSEDTWTEVHNLGISTLSYTLTNLEVGYSYEVRVSAIYGDNESAWKNTSFSLMYSTPAPTSVDGNGITNVTYGSGAEVVNYDTSKTPYYQNNTAQVGAVTAGSETTVAITFSTGYTYGTVVWVDWNQNYEFEDSEIVFAGESTSAKPTTLNATFTVPSEQAAGNYRMRICAADSYYDSHKAMDKAAGANPTPTASYCVAQDYTLKVKEAAAYAMSVSDSDIAFGTVKNTMTTKTFTIVNDGENALENVSVVSSNNEIFTVSETGFDIPAEGSKVITVTFVKDVAGDYSETITVSQANVDNKVINVTATYEAPTPAAMVITIAEAAVGETVAFGSVGKQAEKTFTITNDGDQTLNITSIVSDNTTDFTVSPENLEVAGHSSETFTVTFVYDAEALNVGKTATITITPSNEGVAPKSFTVTGTCIEQWSEDFSGNALPEGWENDHATYWTFNNGYAHGVNNSSNYYLTTPSLTVEEGQSLSFDVRMTSDYYTMTVQKQKDNGSWVDCMDINRNSVDQTMNVWKTITIEGLDAGNYKFRFNSRPFDLDNFEGFKRNLNDPKMGIYSDEECTVAVATSVTTDLGFATTDQTATYYIKNDGTGTMTLSKGDNPAGFTATLDKTSVAAGEHATLTITMPVADNGGYHSGNVVVTATDLGTFTVAVSGVMVDNSKLNLNFATDNIPTTWTANDWMKDANGYIKTGQYGYSNTSMETSTLTATAGEQLVVVAKNGSPSSDYTFGVKYKQVGAEEWSDLIPATNIGTSWKTLTGTIAEAGDYLLQFNGYYASIQRIYGLTEPQEPVMVVYDGESLAGATYDFGNVANDADAEWTLTVKNEGKAVLEGLTAALSGDQAAHYSVEVTGLTDGNLAANATATITVKQLKDNLGAHAATLTISATSEGIADKVIALSGTTRDASKMYVDFADGIPATWTATGSWTTSSGYAQAPYSGNATLTSPALTIAAGENLTVDLSKQYSSGGELTFRYTINGGVTWTEQNLSSDLTYGSFTTKTLSLGNEESVTAFVQFVGTYYARIDNIYGGTPTTAPMFALTTSEVLTDGKYDFGQSLQVAPADKVFTITNSGNDNLVSTIAATGDVTAILATTDGELSNENQTVTLEPGESATITVSLTFDAAAPGAKTGNVTIDSNDPVADVVLNFTANVLDATAVNINFSDNSKPAGFYSSGWTFTGGYAANNAATEAELITSKLTVAGTEDVLSYQARTYNKSWYDGTLIVQYSTDRKNWTNVATQPSNLNDNYQTFTVSGLEAGDYYLRFAGSRVHVDNIAGWHFATPVAEHDLFFVSIDVPEGSYVPGSEYTATVKVANLRAASETVSAELYIKNVQADVLTEQVIALDETKEFTLIGTVPEEGKHLAYVKVYNDDITIETEPVTFTSAHNLTLAISDFARVGEGEIDANASNQFSAAFNVTVENTGSTEATPVVKIFIGETEVGTATADAAVDAGESKTILVNVTDASAGEGGELEFTAKAYWTAEGEALATSGSNVTITVNAKAPKFALYQDATPVNDGDDVDFGLVKGTTETFSYTIKNEGTAPMELISIVAPEGFEATAVNDANKTIAIDGTLAIGVTLKAEQGKVAGDLVITYKVDANTNNTFTLALSGRSISADTWTEDFESGSIPANWTNDNGWTVFDDVEGNHYATRTGWEPYSIMTPRLQAAKDEELTFDVLSKGYTFSYAYSTDKVNWSDEVVIEITGEQTFTAPAAGNYYLRFTSRGGRLDNLVGFHLNPLDLILDETADNDFDTANYDNVTLNRAFIPGWNTVCLPFAIDNITAFFGDGAYAYTYTGYNEGDLTFTIVEDAMTAATPYLVFVPAAITSKELKNISISSEDAGSVGNENATFTGTYDRIAAGNLAGNYVLTPDATIQKAGTSAWMNAFRAYFTIPSGNVKALVFDGGTATGVRRIELTGNEDVRDIFDLAGRKLNETRKGINIVNGKKVLVK